MITKAVADKIKGIEGLHTISALTHRQIVDLLKRKVITAELFDEEKIVEVFDPEEPKQRYCLCRNPQTANEQKRKCVLSARARVRPWAARSAERGAMRLRKAWARASRLSG